MPAIQGAFERLARAAEDDFVVVAFSGHGTTTHELVAHDSDPYNLGTTTIPLTTSGEWCARIPARRLLIVLNCRFSAVWVRRLSRSTAWRATFNPVEGNLNQISGYGRDILTAPGSTEHAQGNPRRDRQKTRFPFRHRSGCWK